MFPLNQSQLRLAQQEKLLLILSGLMLWQAGCHFANKNIVALPEKHSVRATQLMVLSNVKLKSDHPYLIELSALRDHISKELNLVFNEEREVHVYIFDDQPSYQKYLEKTYPGLPPRRAYFVGTPKELMVFTYWGDRVQEDLRHEFTHGLLHSTLTHVPLWLDEGLAEYFEHGKEPEKHEAPVRLASSMTNGWKPDLARLEKLENIHEMRLIDYHEGWAWVDFLLHHSPDTKGVLQAYLAELKNVKHTEPLSNRLSLVMPTCHDLLAVRINEHSANRKTILTSGHEHPHH